MPSPCPLCSAQESELLYRSTRKNLQRDYLHCPVCDLVFVPPEFHLEASLEKARYSQHNNNVEDAVYRAFLSRLWDVLEPKLQAGAVGLDYGCGPGPALAAMIGEAGYDICVYDPFFAPDKAVLSAEYDFITCSEAIEHFAHPLDEFKTFAKLLKIQGVLGIMTGMLDSWDDFADWHYPHDDTHIVFYSAKTMEWIAQFFDWQVSFPAENVVVFKGQGLV
jgi:hypothetical protein